MAVDPFGDWYPHRVIVSPYAGTDPATGADSFTTPAFQFHGHVEEVVAMTRDSSGEETTSTVTIALPLSAAGVITPGSRVQLPDSEHPDTLVLSVAVAEVGSDLDGVTVMCQ